MRLRRERQRAIAKANRLSSEILVPEADAFIQVAGKTLDNRNRRGFKSPAGSEMIASCYKERI